jgi:hypothetical protein
MVKCATGKSSIKPTIPLYTFVLASDDEWCSGKIEPGAWPPNLSPQLVTAIELQGSSAVLCARKPPIKMRNNTYIFRCYVGNRCIEYSKELRIC